MSRPDPRTEPQEFAQYVADEYRRWSTQFKLGLITENVYRATLFALGWRDPDITTEVNLNFPDKRHWYDAR